MLRVLSFWWSQPLRTVPRQELRDTDRICTVRYASAGQPGRRAFLSARHSSKQAIQNDSTAAHERELASLMRVQSFYRSVFCPSKMKHTSAAIPTDVVFIATYFHSCPSCRAREGRGMLRALSIIANGDANANTARATMLTSIWNLEVEIPLTTIIHVRSPQSRFDVTFSATHHDGDALIKSMHRMPSRENTPRCGYRTEQPVRCLYQCQQQRC